jgi:hypothetical protein
MAKKRKVKEKLERRWKQTGSGLKASWEDR